jgi:hypothetical protein
MTLPDLRASTLLMEANSLEANVPPLDDAKRDGKRKPQR